VTQKRYSFGLLVTVALAGCGPDAERQPEVAVATKSGLTFAKFKAEVYREPESGIYIVDGDTPIETEAQLETFFEHLGEPQALIVDQAGGIDDKWSASQKLNLTYCVSTGFGANYNAVVQAMGAASNAWQRAALVRFVHLGAQDATCTASNANVVFNVSPTSGQPYLARSFFPNSARASRNVLIDSTSFGGIAPYTLPGILRHELGHTIGFRHEHTRPEAGTCFEDNNWRALTTYDSASVMHYPQCNGTNRGDLVLTQRDIFGAARLYGADTMAGEQWAVSWGPNRLDIFGLGTDNQMYHKAWTGTAWAPSAGGWEPLGGVFNSPPSVVAWGPNRLDIFGLGTDNQMYHKAWTGTAWSPAGTGWEPLGGVFSSPPAVVAWGPNRLDIFGLGLDNQMYHKAWTGTAWAPSISGWEPLGGVFNSPPAVVAWGPNRLDIFGLGTDNQMYHKAWTGTAWAPSISGWEALGGVFTSSPTVVSWGANRLDILGLGNDYQLYHKAWTGTAWAPSISGWEPLGGVFTSAPSVAAWGANRLDIFGLGTDSQMYHKAWTGTAWAPSISGWEPQGGAFTNTPATVAWGSNRLDVFDLGTDYQMYHKAWTGTAWYPAGGGWEPLGGVFNEP
jgi:hypothetical protein